MDLKILRYFLTVSNTKNITKAADLLHITQPTLSRQLILLEQNLGVNLFVKHGRSITLTPEGELLKRRARDILDLASLTTKELTEKNTLIAGKITIGLVDCRGSDVIFALIKPFSQSYPNISFNFYSGVTEDIIRKMDDGDIDICLLLDPVDTSRYNAIRLSQYEEWGLLLHQEDELAQKHSIEMIDLINRPLMLPSRPSIINEIENWFGRQKYQLNVLGTYNNLTTPIQAVENQICYAVCVNNSIIHKFKNLCFRPFNPLKNTQALILWKKTRNFNTATELFVKTISCHLIQPIY